MLPRNRSAVVSNRARLCWARELASSGKTSPAWKTPIEERSPSSRLRRSASGDAAAVSPGRGAARHGVRKHDPRVGVVRQERERSTADRLGQRLRTQVGRADRVGLVYNGRTTRFVAPHGQCKSEGQDEPDDSQQRSLQDSEGLPKILLEVAQRPAEEETERGRPNDNREKEERQRPTVQAEEQRDPS